PPLAWLQSPASGAVRYICVGDRCLESLFHRKIPPLVTLGRNSPRSPERLLSARFAVSRGSLPVRQRQRLSIQPVPVGPGPLDHARDILREEQAPPGERRRSFADDVEVPLRGPVEALDARAWIAG